MRKAIEINGKTYVPAELTFNTICRMEEMGAALTDAENRSMSLLRAYVSVTMNVPEKVGGEEFEKHIINGGKIDDIANCLTEAIEESGFFQALQKNEEQEASSVETKKK